MYVIIYRLCVHAAWQIYALRVSKNKLLCVRERFRKDNSARDCGVYFTPTTTTTSTNTICGAEIKRVSRNNLYI